MSAPPGLEVTPVSRRKDERREVPQATSDVEQTIADAHRMLEQGGVTRSPSWVSRTVRAFLWKGPTGLEFIDYLDARLHLDAQTRRRLIGLDPDLSGRLPYADPTGNLAGRRLDRAGWAERVAKRA